MILLKEDTRTVEQRDDLWITPDWTSLRRGNPSGNYVEIAEDTPAEWGRVGRCLDGLPITTDARIAVVGAGLCVAPRILERWSPEEIVIYELEPNLVGALEENYPNRWTFVVGDWRATLEPGFDLLFFDTGERLTDEEADRIRSAAASVAGLEET